MVKKSKKRSFGEITKREYASIQFEEREPINHPRSPHSFFETSHNIKFSDCRNSFEMQQVVHKHRNDLCIVTAGGKIPPNVKSIHFVACEAPAFSAAQKRKRQTKMLQGQKLEDAVSPSTTLVELELESGEKIALKACVFGTIIELNKNLTPEVLKDDPLLDGFLAIILPSGSFPPHENQDQAATESSHEARSKTKDNATTEIEA
ncbi:unnamed protein product [Cylindrotheca closterium]|uniref:Protein Abitram n=1 Tax=Cylindrotheca closterium TaxID=2856 RepID=A0AAD2G301_9STRA|nr:unnamed protein product [Cylindrotheca closterium]